MTTTDTRSSPSGNAKLLLTLLSFAGTLGIFLVLGARQAANGDRRAREVPALPPLPTLESGEAIEPEIVPRIPRRRPAPVATTRSSR